VTRHRLHYADWSWREYAAAAGCLLSGRIQRGDAPRRLALAFAALYAPSTAYPVNYGHTAIGMALALFRTLQPARSEVLVPAYICPSVVATVEQAGLVAVPVRVGADLNLLPEAVRAATGPATLAVIAPHMFGCPARIVEIEAHCRQAGVFLVDDAAQVVGERSDGRLLGSFGDVGIVSFAQSKAVVTGVRGSGGVLLVNNPALDAGLRQAWEALPAPRGRAAAFAGFVWNFMWSRYTGNSGYYFARLRARLGGAPAQASGPAHISNLEASIALVQLRRLAAIRAAKAGALEAYHAALSALPGVGMPQYAPGRYLSRIMLSLPAGVDAGALRRALAQHGVETRLGYLEPVRAGEPDDDELAAIRGLVGLPFGKLKCSEIDKICSIVKSCLAAVRPALLEPPQHETYQTAHQR
jgi:dTDP-4-amino-4,6-dideoxygalactose transaminase